MLVTSQQAVPDVAPQVLWQSMSAVQEGAHVLATAASFGGVVGTGLGAEASVVVVPESTTSSTGVSEPAQANSSAPAANAEATAKSAAGEGRTPTAEEEFEGEDVTVRMDYSRKRASTTFGPQINH